MITKPFEAGLVAEVVRRAVVLETADGLGRRDHHSADGVLDQGLVLRFGMRGAHACLMY